MSALSDLKWKTQHVRPDKDGRTVAYILDENGKRIAVSKTRMTGEEADAMAEAYAEKVKKERELK